MHTKTFITLLDFSPFLFHILSFSLLHLFFLFAQIWPWADLSWRPHICSSPLHVPSYRITFTFCHVSNCSYSTCLSFSLPHILLYDFYTIKKFQRARPLTSLLSCNLHNLFLLSCLASFHFIGDFLLRLNMYEQHFWC